MYLEGAASSCRHRWLNPVGLADWVSLPNPHSCRYRGTNPVGGGLLASPSLAQTVGLADCTGLPNPHSCRYCGTNAGFDFLFVSLTWFKPRERLSLANRWMCQYPWGKNTGVRTMVQTGGKLTCRNSKTARNLYCRSAHKMLSSSVLWSAPLLVSLSLAQTGSDPGMRLRGDLPKSRASSLDWCANPVV